MDSSEKGKVKEKGQMDGNGSLWPMLLANL
jgi:hypothetical protein